MADDDMVLVGEFDPRVQMYWYLQGVWLHLVLCTALVGCVTLPIWLVVGIPLARIRYARLKVSVSKKAIHLKTGAWVKVEKTIPLDKIQDLSLRSGPLLDMFGVASVQIETAGQAMAGADMRLEGLRDAKGFRDAVLAQRDALFDRRHEPAAGAGLGDGEAVEVLRDIRDTLARLEKRLDER